MCVEFRVSQKIWGGWECTRVYGKKNASNMAKMFMAKNLGSYPLQSVVCTELSSVMCWESVNTN